MEMQKIKVNYLPDNNGEFLPYIGSPKVWDTPKQMYDAFTAYTKYIDENPLMVADVYGKNPEIIEVPKMRGYTIFGFCKFCSTHSRIFDNYCKKEGFVDLCEYIRTSCTDRNIGGAMAGVLNSGIVTRLEGLVEKKQLESKEVLTVRLHIPFVEIDNTKDLDNEGWELIP